MKKIILSATVAFTFLVTTNAFAQQGFGTNKPDKSAAVDIVSSKRGLLIPRVALTSTDSNNLQSGPIANPAHSLFVYNTATAGSGATAVTPGFYYWERDDASLAGTNWAGKWVRFTSTNNERDVIVQADPNGNIDIPAATYDANGVKTYNVSVKGGSKEGQVLVTKVEGGTTSTVWIDPNEFVKDVVDAKNGLTYVPAANAGDKNTIKLGGTLTEKTIIATDNGNTLSITGLENVTAPADTDTILIMDANGVLKTTSKSNLFDAKNLTLATELSFVTGDGVGAVLKDVQIGIKDKSVGAGKLDATGQTEGHVATVNADGTVSYEPITPGSLTGKETLSTDGIIVVGANETSATANSIAEAVLTPTYLKIKDASITTLQIENGTIKSEDMHSEGNSKVLVTDASGLVTWVDQKDLGNKDGYIFDAPLEKSAGTANNTGGTDYSVSIKTASATTLGVVKEAATAPTVSINAAGELAVDLTNTTLSGDVTGPLNATTVGKIQGTQVSSTAPTTTNNVLKFDGTSWAPGKLDGGDITGAALTSTTLKVTPDANNALLEALKIEVKPGTIGQVLTTTGTAGSEVATWATPNSLVTVNNGLNKETNEEIRLGGALMEPTIITAGATNTLAIQGLEKVADAKANKVVVVEEGTGILRTGERVVSGTNANIAANAGYSFYVPEVIVNITLADADQSIVFPAAASAKGQVINIKIANRTEDHTGYLTVGDTYGGMPFQGWIVKSNGTDWVIVGRN